MGFSARILADSLAPCGARLTTIEATYPRIIHSEMLTHRMLSRSSASSRAIPPEKLIQRVLDDPFIPEHIGKNQKGMQAEEQLADEQRQWAVAQWIAARDSAVESTRQMIKLGVHKQVVNRLIEPWMWITVIISMTERDNLFALRCHEAAEPHMQKIMYMVRGACDASTPRVLSAGEWHLPLIDWDDEIDNSIAPADLIKVSVGRCARVSYLTHDGKRDPAEDIRLHNDLMMKRPLHASPAEHVAQAQAEAKWSGNFYGFTQYRKTLPFENVGRAP